MNKFSCLLNFDSMQLRETTFASVLDFVFCTAFCHWIFRDAIQEPLVNSGNGWKHVNQLCIFDVHVQSQSCAEPLSIANLMGYFCVFSLILSDHFSISFAFHFTNSMCVLVSAHWYNLLKTCLFGWNGDHVIGLNFKKKQNKSWNAHFSFVSSDLCKFVNSLEMFVSKVNFSI